MDTEIYFVQQENGREEVITLKRNLLMEEEDEEEVLIEETLEPPKQKKTRVTPDQQEEMLVLQSEGKTVLQIAQQMGLKRTTVHEVLKRTNKMVRTNILKLRRMKKKRRKRNKKEELLTDEQVDMVNDWLDEDSLLSMQKIVNRLKETCGITVSKSFISKIIDDFHYSIIRVQPPESEVKVQQDKKLINARKEYAKNFIDMQRDLDENQIVFVHFAQFKVLIRANSTVPNERSAKRSIFNHVALALTKEGVLAYTSQYMAMEPEDIVSFFAKLLDKMRRRGMDNKGLIILDDRALYPVEEEVVHTILTSGYECLRLPNHSPFLNPIERLFEGWKKLTKRTEVFDEKQLVQAIDTLDKKLTTEDCEDCYFQALSTLLQCYHGKRFAADQRTSFRPL